MDSNFQRSRPPKNGVFDRGVAKCHAKKLALSMRATCSCDDLKLSVSDASSMKGVSTMQKETKMKTFLASSGKSESR